MKFIFPRLCYIYRQKNWSLYKRSKEGKDNPIDKHNPANFDLT